MTRDWRLLALLAVVPSAALPARARPNPAPDQTLSAPALLLQSKVISPLGSGPDRRALRLDDLFVETEQGRVALPGELIGKPQKDGTMEGQAKLQDGRLIKLTVTPEGDNYTVKLTAEPAIGVVKWGFAIEAGKDEYFTGVMERLVDGPQQLSWAEGRTEVLNLRGQKIDMILKPTLGLYAPFYISSRGYAFFAETDWPGHFDFCDTDPDRVAIEFEGPSFEMKIYTAKDPATLVREHAMDAGPPFLPPKWMYTPWRWRDENTQRSTYYDGTPVTGPFNSEFMEDVLLMKAYGIPNGVMWIDRPWGPGPSGYDDFDIDYARMPNFEASVKWLNENNTQMLMWIGPFFQGKMKEEALARGYNLPGQAPQVPRISTESHACRQPNSRRKIHQ